MTEAIRYIEQLIKMGLFECSAIEAAAEQFQTEVYILQREFEKAKKNKAENIKESR